MLPAMLRLTGYHRVHPDQLGSPHIVIAPQLIQQFLRRVARRSSHLISRSSLQERTASCSMSVSCAVHPAVPAQDGHRRHGDRPIRPGCARGSTGAVPGELAWPMQTAGCARRLAASTSMPFPARNVWIAERSMLAGPLTSEQAGCVCCACRCRCSSPRIQPTLVSGAGGDLRSCGGQRGMCCMQAQQQRQLNRAQVEAH